MYVIIKHVKTQNNLASKRLPVILLNSDTEVWEFDTKEEAEKKAQEIAASAKEERMVDLEKGFAGEKEAKEFAEKMKDPKFREEYEKKMKEAEQKALRKAEGGSAVVANVSEYTPEIAIKAGEAIERGNEWVGEKIYQWIPDSVKKAMGG